MSNSRSPPVKLGVYPINYKLVGRTICINSWHDEVTGEEFPTGNGRELADMTFLVDDNTDIQIMLNKSPVSNLEYGKDSVTGMDYVKIIH